MSDFDSHRPESKTMSEAEMIMEEKLRKKKEEDEEMWMEYIEQRKQQRAKDDEDLRKLKERQAKRRGQRAEQEKAMMEYKRKADEQRQRDVEEKKAKEAEAKIKRLEEAERKRQAMQAAKDKKEMEPAKPNFTITKKQGVDDLGSALGSSSFDKMANIMHAKGEMGKTKDQLDDDKKAILTFRVGALAIEGLSIDDLKKKAKELWEKIVTLESDKYDLEERQKRQDYDLKELAERQRQINRNKALKKGLDPEALSGKYPPKIQVASKYERRTDRRTYGDKKELWSGGWEAVFDADNEKIWEDKMMAFKEREGPKELPKWDPENPKNKQVYDRTKAEYDDDDDDIPLPVFKPPEELSMPKSAPEPEYEEEEAAEEEAEEEEEEEE